ncbi:hypothetical protein PVK06_029954 [Gossypium arboreum]|uniref:Uncharacterized protein n=1 Tax=Gossypium arboreum TaxID=29729 RepID=A0ABR0NM69_GOSAR|nr:hypothetical protein PVK06_029954 [Gossypium arboreum]
MWKQCGLTSGNVENIINDSILHQLLPLKDMFLYHHHPKALQLQTKLAMPKLWLEVELVAANRVGPLRPPFSEGSSLNVVVDHLRLPRPPSGGSSSTSLFMIFEFPNTDIDLSEGDNLVFFSGQDVGPGHYLLGPLGNSYPASEFGRNYFEVFNGESSSSSSGATSGSI